ncbi:hypothetical protein [Arenimonas sp.]|uniref:hypothetical protein n=1 Tax=Arenimonas sp. TaxID=1872635 RepID=UPI0025FEC082|nr:hypothetical protein [Arenimonas sp.]
MSFARDAAFAAGLMLLAAGLWLQPFDWPALAPRLLDSTVLAVALLAASLLAAWRLRTSAAQALATLALPLLAVVFAGPVAVAATALLLAGGLALGTLLPRVEGTPLLLRWIAGLGLLAGGAGWLLPLPLHSAASWSVALLALVAWRRKALAAGLREFGSEAAGSLRAAPGAALLAMLAVAVAGASAWLPVLMSDDLSYHVALGWELRELGHARFDVGSQVWALAPWSADVLHALVMVMADREVVGPLNTFWLLAATWLVQALGLRLGLPARAAWLAAAAYASLPLSGVLAGTLQVESATPAMLAAIALLLLARTAPGRAPTILIAVLAGTMLGTKVSNLVFLAPCLAWWLLQWRGRLPWTALPGATGLAVLAGGSSYAYAAWLAGNPVLPLFNGTFASPWFPLQDFVDMTWQHGLRWSLPWDWIFQSQAYHEAAAAGAGGVVALALAGGVFAALWNPRTRAFALFALACVALMVWQVQYMRYAHPAMTLLVPLLLAGVWRERAAWQPVALGALVALQLALVPTASWNVMGGALRTLALDGPAGVVAAFAPERLLARHFRATAAPSDRLLFAHGSLDVQAELPGRAQPVSWHNPRLFALHAGGQAGLPVLEASGASHVVARGLDANPEFAAALRERGATPIAHAGPATLYRLAPAWRPMQTVQAGPREATATLALDPAHALVGTVSVTVACDRPGENLLVAWRLDRPGNQGPDQHWAWEACGADGQARARTSLASAPNTGELSLQLRPVDEASTMQLRIIDGQADLRRDTLAESALQGRAWNGPCLRRGCSREATRLLPTATAGAWP